MAPRRTPHLLLSALLMLAASWQAACSGTADDDLVATVEAPLPGLDKLPFRPTSKEEAMLEALEQEKTFRSEPVRPRKLRNGRESLAAARRMPRDGHRCALQRSTPPLQRANPRAASPPQDALGGVYALWKDVFNATTTAVDTDYVKGGSEVRRWRGRPFIHPAGAARRSARRPTGGGGGQGGQRREAGRQSHPRFQLTRFLMALRPCRHVSINCRINTGEQCGRTT